MIDLLSARERLQYGIQKLNDLNPDLAAERNDSGFNKGHSLRGLALAHIPADLWNPEDLYDAWKILRTYKQTQVAEIGWDELPVPAQPNNAEVVAWERANPEKKTARQQALAAYDPRYAQPAPYRAWLADARETGARYLRGPVIVLATPRSPKFLAAFRALGLAREEREFLESGRRGDARTGPVWLVKNSVDLTLLLEEFRFDVEPEVWSMPEPERRENPRQATLANGALKLVYGSYDGRFVAAIKAIEPWSHRKYEGSDQSWNIPLRPDTLQSVARALAIAREFDFALAPDVQTTLASIEQDAREAAERAAQAERAQKARAQENRSASQALDASIEVEGLARPPFAHQRAGISYIVSNLAPGKGVLVADDMGLGKSFEAIAAIQHLDLYPCLVVTTASSKHVWRREWDLTVPGKKITVVNGKGIVPGQDVIALNYDALGKHLEALLSYGFKSLVIDEAHYIKGDIRKVRRAERVYALSRAIAHVLLLTGTPVLNRPTELLTPLKVMNRLDELGGFRHFMFELCGASYGSFGLVTPDPRTMNAEGRERFNRRMQTLNDLLRAHCYIRREKADAIDLPARRTIEVPVEIVNRDEYERAREDIIAYAARLAAQDEDFLRSLAELPEDERAQARRDRADDAARRAERAKVLVEINRLRQLTARGKLPAVIEYVQSIMELGRKVVVFAWHKEVVDALATAFQCHKIAGGVDPETRAEIVDDFQENPDTLCLVVQILSGGEAITLTAAADCIFVEQAWNPGKMDQARDRLHRIGQTDTVTAHYLLGVETIDEPMMELIESKRQPLSALTTGAVVAEETQMGDMAYILRYLQGQ